MDLRWNIGAAIKTFLLWGLLLSLSSLLAPSLAWSEESSGRTILENRCSGCHAPREADGKYDEIEFQRKTPEGWQMTIQRMVRTHGAVLEEGEVRQLVKYLSDHYGLAPSEVEPFRFILERRNITVTQEVPAPLQAGCVQCHSYARVALQRRTPEAWLGLADAKVALMPNIGSETASAGLLFDSWYTTAKNQAMPYLAKAQPFETEAWTKWQAVAKPDLAGIWKVIGHDPGKGGDYTGHLTVEAVGDDQYTGEFTHTFADGSTVSGKTKAIVYTGFQWRGVAEGEGGQKHHEVFFAIQDGSIMRGRRLLTNFGDLGRDETLYKSQGKATLLTVTPAAVKAGETYKLRLFGMDFPSDLLTAGTLSLGEGVQVQLLRLERDDTVVAEVKIDENAKTGPRRVTLQGVTGQGTFSVYTTPDYIRVEPEHGFARPGGIRTPKIFQQFEVFGYWNGPDGKKGTADDIKLTRVAPVSWKLEEYVKRVNDDDVRFVGAVDQTGLFTPEKDGPNPKRHRLEGNVGDVWVEAWYQPDGVKYPMGARAYLLVMPPKFIFPLIE